MGRAALPLLWVILVILPQAVTAPRAAAQPMVTSGFELVDYPSGQQPYNLTDFAWLDDGSLLTIGKDGTVVFVKSVGRHGSSPRWLGSGPPGITACSAWRWPETTR